MRFYRKIKHCGDGFDQRRRLTYHKHHNHWPRVKHMLNRGCKYKKIHVEILTIRKRTFDFRRIDSLKINFKIFFYVYNTRKRFVSSQMENINFSRPTVINCSKLSFFLSRLVVLITSSVKNDAKKKRTTK